MKDEQIRREGKDLLYLSDTGALVPADTLTGKTDYHQPYYQFQAAKEGRLFVRGAMAEKPRQVLVGPDHHPRITEELEAIPYTPLPLPKKPGFWDYLLYPFRYKMIRAYNEAVEANERLSRWLQSETLQQSLDELRTKGKEEVQEENRRLERELELERERERQKLEEKEKEEQLKLEQQKKEEQPKLEEIHTVIPEPPEVPNVPEVPVVPEIPKAPEGSKSSDEPEDMEEKPLTEEEKFYESVMSAVFKDRVQLDELEMGSEWMGVYADRDDFVQLVKDPDTNKKPGNAQYQKSIDEVNTRAEEQANTVTTFPNEIARTTFIRNLVAKESMERELKVVDRIHREIGRFTLEETAFHGLARLCQGENGPVGSEIRDKNLSRVLKQVSDAYLRGVQAKSDIFDHVTEVKSMSEEEVQEALVDIYLGELLRANVAAYHAKCIAEDKFTINPMFRQLAMEPRRLEGLRENLRSSEQLQTVMEDYRKNGREALIIPISDRIDVKGLTLEGLLPKVAVPEGKKIPPNVDRNIRYRVNALSRQLERAESGATVLDPSAGPFSRSTLYTARRANDHHILGLRQRRDLMESLIQGVKPEPEQLRDMLGDILLGEHLRQLIQAANGRGLSGDENPIYQALEGDSGSFDREKDNLLKAPQVQELLEAGVEGLLQVVRSNDALETVYQQALQYAAVTFRSEDYPVQTEEVPPPEMKEQPMERRERQVTQLPAPESREKAVKKIRDLEGQLKAAAPLDSKDIFEYETTLHPAVAEVEGRYKKGLQDRVELMKQMLIRVERHNATYDLEQAESMLGNALLAEMLNRQINGKNPKDINDKTHIYRVVNSDELALDHAKEEMLNTPEVQNLLKGSPKEVLDILSGTGFTKLYSAAVKKVSLGGKKTVNVELFTAESKAAVSADEKNLLYGMRKGEIMADAGARARVELLEAYRDQREMDKIEKAGLVYRRKGELMRLHLATAFFGRYLQLCENYYGAKSPALRDLYQHIGDEDEKNRKYLDENEEDGLSEDYIDSILNTSKLTELYEQGSSVIAAVMQDEEQFNRWALDIVGDSEMIRDNGITIGEQDRQAMVKLKLEGGPDMNRYSAEKAQIRIERASAKIDKLYDTEDEPLFSKETMEQVADKERQAGMRQINKLVKEGKEMRLEVLEYLRDEGRSSYQSKSTMNSQLAKVIIGRYIQMQGEKNQGDAESALRGLGLQLARGNVSGKTMAEEMVNEAVANVVNLDAPDMLSILMSDEALDALCERAMEGSPLVRDVIRGREVKELHPGYEPEPEVESPRIRDALKGYRQDRKEAPEKEEIKQTINALKTERQEPIFKDGVMDRIRDKEIQKGMKRAERWVKEGLSIQIDLIEEFLKRGPVEEKLYDMPDQTKREMFARILLGRFLITMDEQDERAHRRRNDVELEGFYQKLARKGVDQNRLLQKFENCNTVNRMLDMEPRELLELLSDACELEEISRVAAAEEPVLANIFGIKAEPTTYQRKPQKQDMPIAEEDPREKKMLYSIYDLKHTDYAAAMDDFMRFYELEESGLKGIQMVKDLCVKANKERVELLETYQKEKDFVTLDWEERERMLADILLSNYIVSSEGEQIVKMQKKNEEMKTEPAQDILYKNLGEGKVGLKGMTLQLQKGDTVKKMMMLSDTVLADILLNGSKLNDLAVQAFQNIKPMKKAGNAKANVSGKTINTKQVTVTQK